MPDLDKPNDARVADGARPALARLDVAVAEFSRAAKRAAADLGLRDVLTGFEAAHAALRETNPTEGLAQDVAAALRGDVAPQVVLDGIEALITRALPTAEAAIDPDLDDATFAQAMVTRQEAREDMAAGAAVTALFDAANEVVRAVERAQPTPDPAPHAPRWSERTLEASHDAFIERLRASTADETGRTRLQRLDDSIAAQPEPTLRRVLESNRSRYLISEEKVFETFVHVMSVVGASPERWDAFVDGYAAHAHRGEPSVERRTAMEDAARAGASDVFVAFVRDVLFHHNELDLAAIKEQRERTGGAVLEYRVSDQHAMYPQNPGYIRDVFDALDTSILGGFFGESPSTRWKDLVMLTSRMEIK